MRFVARLLSRTQEANDLPLLRWSTRPSTDPSSRNSQDGRKSPRHLPSPWMRDQVQARGPSLSRIESGKFTWLWEAGKGELRTSLAVRQRNSLVPRNHLPRSRRRSSPRDLPQRTHLVPRRRSFLSFLEAKDEAAHVKVCVYHRSVSSALVACFRD